MTRGQIVKQVNKAICGMSKGLFSDEYWNGIKPITEYLNNSEHNFYLSGSRYLHENGRPSSKEWLYISEATKKPIVVIIIASGAGTVEDPLSKYDVICYAS